MFDKIIVIGSVLIGMMCAIGCSCVNIEENVDKSSGTIVKTKYNSSKVLNNPMNGWVMYVGANADVSYLDTEFYVPSLNKNVKVRDYASSCYIRTKWSVLNPADGVYAWEDPTSNLYKLIERIEELGIPIAFRVVVDGRDQGANTPQFVFDAGAEYAVENNDFPDRKTPLPQDPVFQKYYEKFVTAFGERFNNADKTAFIDGFGLGKWGEGHSVAYCSDDVTRVDENTETLKREVLDWITKLYARNFTEVPLVINYHRFLGHPASEGSTPNEESESLVALAVSNGYCIRSDAFGMNNSKWGYGNWEKSIAANYRYKLPIVLEGGWIVSSHSYWNDDAGYRQGHPEDVRQGEYNAASEAHVNMMDFRVGDETASWFQDSFPLVEKFVANGGYRVYPDRIHLPGQILGGSVANITHRWKNTGWGYLPNNLHQWNYKYKVAFALLNAEGKAVKIFVDEKCEPSEWIKGKSYSYKFSPTVNVAQGNYTWGIAIVNTRKGNLPSIELAVNDEVTDEGWIKLIDVKVL